MNRCKRPLGCPASPAPSKRAKVEEAATTIPLHYWTPSYQPSLNVYISGFYLHGLLRFFSQHVLAGIQEQGIPAGDKLSAIIHDFLVAEWKKGKIRFLCANVGLCSLEDDLAGDPSPACSKATTTTTNGETHQAQLGKITALPSSKPTPADGQDFAKSMDEIPMPDVKWARGKEEVCASTVNTDQTCVVQTKKVCGRKSKASQACRAVKEVEQQTEQSMQTDTHTVTTAHNTEPCASCKNCAAQISEACRQYLDGSSQSSQTPSDDPQQPDSSPAEAAPVQVLGDRISLRKTIQQQGNFFRPNLTNLVQLTGPIDDEVEECGPDQTDTAIVDGLPEEDASFTQWLEAAAGQQAGGAEAQSESTTSPVNTTWLEKAFSPSDMAQPVRCAHGRGSVPSGFTSDQARGAQDVLYSASSTDSNCAQLNCVHRGKNPPLPVSDNGSQFQNVHQSGGNIMLPADVLCDGLKPSSKRHLKTFTNTTVPVRNIPRPSDIANYSTRTKKRASKKNTSQTLSTPNQQGSDAYMARNGSAAQNTSTPPPASQIHDNPVQPVFLQPATLSGHASVSPQQESLIQMIEHQFDRMTRQTTCQTPAALSACSDKTWNPVVSTSKNGSIDSARLQTSSCAVNSKPVASWGQAGNVPLSSLHDNPPRDGRKKRDGKIALMKSLLNQIETVVSAKLGVNPTHHQHQSWKQVEEANSLGVSADHLKFDAAKTAGHETAGIVAETVSSEQSTTDISEPEKSVDESGPWQKRGFSVHRHEPSLHKTALLDKHTGENTYSSPSELTRVYHEAEQMGAVCKSVSTSQKTSSGHFFEGRVPSLDEIPLPDEKPRRSRTPNGRKIGKSPGVGLSPRVVEVLETSPEGLHHSGVGVGLSPRVVEVLETSPEGLHHSGVGVGLSPRVEEVLETSPEGLHHSGVGVGLSPRVEEVLETSPEGLHHSGVQTAGHEDAGTATEQGQTSHNSTTKRGQIETLASQIQVIVGRLSGGCAPTNAGLSPSQETLSPGTSCAQDSSIPSASQTQESASPSTQHTGEGAGSSEGASSEGTPSQAACPLSDAIQPEHDGSCPTASAQSPSSVCFLPGTTGEKNGLGIGNYVDSNDNTEVSKAVESVIARKISSLIRNRSNLSASAIREQCSHLVSRCLATRRKGERSHPGVAADEPRKKNGWMMTSRPHCVNRRIMTDPILKRESSTVMDVVARRDGTTLTDSWLKDAWTTTRRFKPIISRSSQTVRCGVAEVGTVTKLLSPPVIKPIISRSSQTVRCGVAEVGTVTELLSPPVIKPQGRTTLGTPSKTTLAAAASTTSHHQPGQVIAEQLTTTTTCQETINVDGEEVGHHTALVQNISHCVLTEKGGGDNGQPAGVTPGSTAAADQGTVRITIRVKVAKGSKIRLAS